MSNTIHISQNKKGKSKKNINTIIKNKPFVNNYGKLQKALGRPNNTSTRHFFSVRSRFNFENDNLEFDFKQKSHSVKSHNTGDPAKDIENMLDDYYRQSSKTANDYKNFNRENRDFVDSYKLFQEKTEKEKINVIEKRNIFRSSPLLIFDKDEMKMFYMGNQELLKDPEKDKAKFYLNKVRRRIALKKHNLDEAYPNISCSNNFESNLLNNQIEETKKSITKAKSTLELLDKTKFLFDEEKETDISSTVKTKVFFTPMKKKFFGLSKKAYTNQTQEKLIEKVLAKKEALQKSLFKKTRNSAHKHSPNSSMHSINKTKSTTYTIEKLITSKDHENNNSNTISYLYEKLRSEALSLDNKALNLIEKYFEINNIKLNKNISRQDILKLFKNLVNKIECFNYEGTIKKFYLNHPINNPNIRRNVIEIGNLENELKKTDLLFCKSLIGNQLKK